ncbi:hypothetical protein [Parafrankia sp. BMG5.11]|uniref:hypothetical protein n=1 Tax=Parafrankia sp. BMG5.11 TaxID=222540 RepID=UPI00103CE11E|nr:hypothetical protein [Parafrankia sp. BMG5.11]TCJ39327.1 hypothetical protein E0504_09350 [Parafrankia sp. BMG5.11]
MMKIPALVLALAPLSVTACAVVPPADSTPPQPAGYAVPIGQPVQVGDLILTPRKLVEDSRCPMNARCVWAGRVVVKTTIAGAGWADTADLTLGEPYGTHGKVIALVSVRPEKMAGTETQPMEYRFVYEPR